ncbi:hypothetical protein SS1G_07016 [Sclerotinia sclerotiorum 1980 UF-70]|uniref:Uncharacterized protein n=1 Tax=Sclerotinia sclerotiorum (strain ATCC 18683 / 1980 / Ss-1) TaxID=665079 RepID=A7ENW7_SCLS1|nr:hypothetical protein SS1G_07016 [Sclerotinia sclerotiorum 1980 UF-70]EDO04533.1 hypothetical protein SS1G_07016 [Sclerotinia sclerotiorum 1980 UF-70]
MSANKNGHINGGANGYDAGNPNGRMISKRFSDIPSAIDIPVTGEDDDQAVEIDLEDLLDDPTELCTLLENEGAARTYWMTVALAYAKQKKVDHAIEMLTKGQSAMRGGNKERLSMLTCLCWMYLWKSKEAPRHRPDNLEDGDEIKTKEDWLKMATSNLNDASRINPSFPPLFLARGVLQLLRASTRPFPKNNTAPGALDPEKAELLRGAQKSFEDAIKASHGRNMLAVLGKARAAFSMGKYAEALEGYQEALRSMPDLVDPDPRIGIGCCFWQLGFKEDAKAAWERSLEINPDSKVANILLAQFYLDQSAHVPTNSPEFIQLYKKAMTEYTQRSYKVDKDMPLTCATFAGYFLSRKSMPNVEALAQKAIQYTDVNAIASDGWYLLARKEHFDDNYEKALDYYGRADDARGGIDRGYMPAKFGAAQLSVLKGDFGEAKLRLEKIIQQSKNIEAMILLGTLYAEEVFSSQESGVKEDKTTEFKKAIGYLENVRTAWKDPKKNLVPDASVLLNLARLYETEQPEKSLQCLQQVEQIEFDQIPAADRPEETDDEAAYKSAMRENLSPQLLNNIGCFYYQSEKYDQAREMFQSALNACVKAGEKLEGMDTDALVTTISFNLGRTYEASAIALVEDKKDFKTALSIFRETFKSALDYSLKALEITPDQVHYKFNVAFVQLQLATTIYNLPETRRSLDEVKGAAKGLEDAIEALDAIAQHPSPPYPKHDIEQRANMARNTMRRQLERSIQAQKEYEEKNASKIQAAKEQREAELRRREEAREAAERADLERKAKIAEERQKIAERDRELAQARAADDIAREAAEMTTDSETGERVKRKKIPKGRSGGGKRKKKEDGVTEDDDSGAEEGGRSQRRSRKARRGSGSDEEKPKTKKRRLAKKGGEKKEESKYKSSEIVVESDSDGDDGAEEVRKAMEGETGGDKDVEMGGQTTSQVNAAGGDSDEEEQVVKSTRKSRRGVIEDDEDDDDNADANPGAANLQDDSPGTVNEDADTPMTGTAAGNNDE